MKHRLAGTNMENKKQVIIFVVAGLVILVLAYFAFFTGGTSNTNKPNTNTGNGGVVPTSAQVFSPSKLPNTRAISLPTNSGSITVNNFFTLQSTKDEFGREVVVLHDSPEYKLMYVYVGNYFEFNLAAPSEKVRQDAEHTLLATLQTSPLDACKLTLFWKIGGPKGGTYPTDLPLSFCPGGLPLE